MPVAGASTAFMFNEKLQVDPLLFGDIIALRATGVFSKYSALMPVRSKNPQEVWCACRNSRIGVFGRPQSVQMDEGGGWRKSADRYVVGIKDQITISRGRCAPLDS